MRFRVLALIFAGLLLAGFGYLAYRLTRRTVPANRTKNLVFDVGKVILKNPWNMREGKGGAHHRQVFKGIRSSCARKLWFEGYLTADKMTEILSKAGAEGVIEFTHQDVVDAVASFLLSRVPNPETMAIIEQLKTKGYRLYILSNSAREVYNRFVGPNPFFKKFDGLFFSFDAGSVKPEPKIYEKFFNQFGLVPGECLFIDDKPKNIEASEQAGMPGIVYVPGKLEAELVRRGVL
ncbi:MAG: HAD family phosphatase [Candidatus Dependentiae bacterium]|nr:HAD family phosphatase [Candidatus Dependentiae bacterium]